MTDLTLLRQFAVTQRNTTAGAVMTEAAREIEILRTLKNHIRLEMEAASRELLGLKEIGNLCASDK